MNDSRYSEITLKEFESFVKQTKDINVTRVQVDNTYYYDYYCNDEIYGYIIKEDSDSKYYWINK